MSIILKYNFDTYNSKPEQTTMVLVNEHITENEPQKQMANDQVNIHVIHSHVQQKELYYLQNKAL